MKLNFLKLICFLGFLTICLVGCQKINNKKINEPPTPLIEKKELSSVSTAAPQQEIIEPIETKVIEIDLSSYFGEHNGSAVFYSPMNNLYKVYNLEASKEQRSPCSTFKIASTLAALEYGIITEDNSLRLWSGEEFWNSSWNKDISLDEAFKVSCVWYYRMLIDEIGQDRMQSFINSLEYGNKDISDWEGKLNQNNNNRALTGFWIEASLKISPYEQVEMLERIFGSATIFTNENITVLKRIMFVEQDVTPIKIYGKTGYGKQKNVSLDSWFVGMFENDSELEYFAIHLSESENPEVTSAYAKSIAIQMIADKFN